MKLLYLQHLKAYGLCAGLFVLFSCQIEPQIKQLALQSKSVKLLEKDGFQFKDLNANAQLDPYEDWRLSPSARAADLLDQMTLEQKVGFMLISTIRMENEPGGFFFYTNENNPNPFQSMAITNLIKDSIETRRGALICHTPTQYLNSISYGK